jgi:hypothetical protein
MKTPHRFFSHDSGALFVAVSMYGIFFGPHSFAALGSPASKLYVSDLVGEVDLSTPDKITALTKKDVFSAQGSTILTAKASSDTMVYSNGSGIFLDADTRLDVKKFAQEPFTPNRYDLDVEPSVSQTQAYLSHGRISLCTSKLAAGSNMVYTTPQATLNIHAQKLVIEVNEYETRVSVLEGDVTVRSSDGDAGQVVHGGQEAIIRSDAASHTSNIVHAGPIPNERNQFLNDRAAMACIAKRTVYFEVVSRQDAKNKTTTEIEATAVVPVNQPTDFTISPSQLPP